MSIISAKTELLVSMGLIATVVCALLDMKELGVRPTLMIARPILARMAVAVLIWSMTMSAIAFPVGPARTVVQL